MPAAITHHRRVPLPEGEPPRARVAPLDPFTFPVPLAHPLRVEDETFVVPHFSARETQVASLLADGDTYEEIADKLEIGLERVKDVVSTLLKKTKLRDRNRFAAWVWRLRVMAALKLQSLRKPTRYT